MKKNVILIVAISVLMCCLLTSTPIHLNAAEKKITCSDFKNRNNSAILKCGKTYKITKKGYNIGVLRFKATKTKTYTFTLSNYKSIGKTKIKDIGWGSMCAYYEKYLKSDNVTNFPDNTMFWDSIKFNEEDIEGYQSIYFASKKYSSSDKALAAKCAFQTNYETGEKYYDEEVAENYLRTYNEGKIKMKKGEVIYLIFNNMSEKTEKADRKKNKGYTCKLKIK